MESILGRSKVLQQQVQKKQETMNASLIFPNQLFYPNPVLSKNRPIYIFCDPLFFKDRQYPVNFHKQKLLLHLLSIGEYEKELKGYGYDVWVIDETKSKNMTKKIKKYNS